MRGHPDLGRVGRHARGAVHRLHRRVREKRRRIGRLDLPGRASDRLQRIALVALREGVGRCQPLFEVLGDQRAGLRGAGAFVPHDRQRIERALGVPPGVGHHRHRAVVDPHRALDTGARGDRGVVEADQLAAEHRARLDRRVEHAGHAHINGVELAAVELVAGVQALDRLAGHLPGLGILQDDGLGVGRRQLGRRGSHLAVAGAAPAGGVRDHAVGHTQLGHRHLPFVGRRLQQHQPRRRATAAHVVVRGADAAAAAGAHLAPCALGCEIALRRNLLGADLGPVALQLFDHQLRQAGERALPHLRARDADHATLIGPHDDPDVELAAFARGLGAGVERRRPAEHEGAGSGTGGDDEFAARQLVERGTWMWSSSCLLKPWPS